MADLKPKTALVLSGGGARGAYEAGVMRYIRDELPKSVKCSAKFDVICGTSVGAINCCFLAGTNHEPEIQGKGLAELWSTLKIEGIYKMGLKELMRMPRFLFGAKKKNFIKMSHLNRLGGLFDTTPLEELVYSMIDWNQIRRNLASGHLNALAINATHVATGKTHVFIDRFEGGIPPWSTDPEIEAFAAKIGSEHALASAAIPWIFPSVRVASELYCDGGVKLNTPISPALRLGANKLFVVGLKPRTLDEEIIEHAEKNLTVFPSAIYILGKLLSGLMVDKTEYEFKRLERFNELLSAGEERFGEPFKEAISKVMLPLRGATYRNVETLIVRPSENIASIASKHLQLDNIAERTGGLLKPLLKRLTFSEAGQAGDIASFLLFDGQYAQDLIRLGMQDADAQRQEIINFFKN